MPRNPVAIAVVLVTGYGLVLLLRPLALLLAFDIDTVNPPGAVGGVIRTLAFVHHYLLPAAYLLVGLSMLRYSRLASGGLLINLAAEVVLVAFLLYIMGQSDMLSIRQVPAWWLACLYLLVPGSICAFALRALANSGRR